jgi:hypothetical protein
MYIISEFEANMQLGCSPVDRCSSSFLLFLAAPEERQEGSELKASKKISETLFQQITPGLCRKTKEVNHVQVFQDTNINPYMLTTYPSSSRHLSQRANSYFFAKSF